MKMDLGPRNMAETAFFHSKDIHSSIAVTGCVQPVTAMQLCRQHANRSFADHVTSEEWNQFLINLAKILEDHSLLNFFCNDTQEPWDCRWLQVPKWIEQG
jgi:hypothetical protein